MPRVEARSPRQKDPHLTDWKKIVDEHGSMAFDAAWRILGNVSDVEDVVQDALLEAFQLHQRQQVVNWGGMLRCLATCRAIDRLRRRRPWASLPSDDDAGAFAASASTRPEALAEERELAERLRAAVAELTERESQVFSLRFFADESNQRIAEGLGIDVDTVAVILHRARQKLKEILLLAATASRRAIE